MKTVRIGPYRFKVKRVVESHEEPVGTPGLLWIHYDPVARVKLYFLWRHSRWLNLGTIDTCCGDCCGGSCGDCGSCGLDCEYSHCGCNCDCDCDCDWEDNLEEGCQCQDLNY